MATSRGHFFDGTTDPLHGVNLKNALPDTLVVASTNTSSALLSDGVTAYDNRRSTTNQFLRASKIKYLSKKLGNVPEAN